ncbi:MAG TPA: oligosaccharide flippase family protein [Candidatus Stackebrandtia excrementipullorum]|nr:oligosaccharide flippase family protein [Candidatus Stackebrandtia excrementipullorum]
MSLSKFVESARLLISKLSIRTILPLVGARAVYRVGMALSSVILIVEWGKDEFAGYALAIGTFGVLSFVTTMGVEKSALKLIPRARYTARQLTTLFVLLPALLSAACALGVVWYGLNSDYPLLMIMGGGLAICGGVNQVLVGLHRVHGRPHRDMINYLLLFVSVVVAVACAVFGGLGPVGVMGIMLGSVFVANLILVPTLPLTRVRNIRKPLVWSSIRASALMSADEIAGSAIISLGFLLIGHSDFRSQAAYMYVVLESSTFMMAGFGYILRILQPRISVYMHRSDSAAAMFERAKYWLKIMLISGPPYLVLVAVGGFTWEATTGAPAGPVLIFLLYLSSVPFFLLIGTINYLLENHDNTSFISTAAGSMAGMIGACAVSLALVPWIGALGAMLTWALADIIHAATILLIFRYKRKTTLSAPAAETSTVDSVCRPVDTFERNGLPR